jgi:hypothetical protein
MLPNGHVFRSIECEVFHEYAAQTLIPVFYVLSEVGISLVPVDIVMQ